MEIIVDDNGKRMSFKIPVVKRLKQMLAIAGLPPAAIQAQLAIKKLVTNPGKWQPTKKTWENDPERAQWLHNINDELCKAHNVLSEYNTNQQSKNLDILLTSPKQKS